MKICNKKLDMALARNCMTLSKLRRVVSPQTLTRIRGGQEVKPATVGIIAKELGVDPAEIIEEVE